MPAGGTTTTGDFTGTVSLRAPAISAFGVPHTLFRAIAAGSSVTAHVTVANAGNAPMSVFIDPRSEQQTLYPLQSITPATGLTLPFNTGTTPPLFLVPTDTSTLFAAAQATAPVTFDWGFGDPDVIARSHGDTASGSFSASEVTAGLWALSPSLLGPFFRPGDRDR